MTISRLQPTTSTSLKPAKAPSLAGTPAKAAVSSQSAVSGDSLALSTGTAHENAEARALFLKGQALDAQGYTTPANDVFKKAIKAAESVDTLLAIRAIAERSENNAYSHPGRSVWSESLYKADTIASQQPVATGANPVRAYQTQAETWISHGLEGAAAVNYAKGIEASRSLDEVKALNASMYRHEADFDLPLKEADAKAKDLVKALPAPTRQGDAVTRELTAQADALFRARMPEAGKAMFQRAIASATTLEAMYAVQKSVEKLEEAEGIYPEYDRSGGDDFEFLRGECNGRIWRLEHPLKAWNPLTWLTNKT